MTKREVALMKVMDAVGRALEQYSSDNVDVVADELIGKVDIMYHSRNNSFGIEVGVADMKNIDKVRLAKCLDAVGVGYCW